MTTPPVDLPPLTTDEEVLARIAHGRRTPPARSGSGSSSSTATAASPRPSSRSPACRAVPSRAASTASHGSSPACGGELVTERGPRRGDPRLGAHRAATTRPRRRPRVGRGAHRRLPHRGACRCAGSTSARPAACNGSVNIVGHRGPAVGARLGAARLRRAGAAGRPPGTAALGRGAHGARFRGVPATASTRSRWRSGSPSRSARLSTTRSPPSGPPLERRRAGPAGDGGPLAGPGAAAAGSGAVRRRHRRRAARVAAAGVAADADHGMLTDSRTWHSISTRSAASSRRTTASPASPWCAPTAPRTRRLVNAGVLDHPRTAVPVAGYVTYGKVKLRNLRERPATSILWRAGWQWAGVEGPSELIGPGDTDAESLRLLLRAVFTRLRRHPRRLGHLRPRHARGGPGSRARHARAGLRQRLSGTRRGAKRCAKARAAPAVRHVRTPRGVSGARSRSGASGARSRRSSGRGAAAVPARRVRTRGDGRLPPARRAAPPRGRRTRRGRRPRRRGSPRPPGRR